ncbi:MAG: tRNA pseudouridine(38-40) synthase TruA [Firmicutes bacterium]|nr:tRNA pseudouridine(38-40) synthase TruA [Bacillota bacterium]
MAKVKLTVAYDGTDFHGFSRQPGLRTVQGELEAAVCRICGTPYEVYGASRTDAGVHAKKQVAHIVLDERMQLPIERIGYALRMQMPRDIVVQDVSRVADQFHARHDAMRKVYRYFFATTRAPDVFRARYQMNVPVPLNDEAMRLGAVHLIGRHDFTSFCFAHAQQESKVRTLHSLEVVRVDEATLYLEVVGKSFLHNMVRILAGTLLEVGKGRIPPAQIQHILASRDRRAAGPTAPARGLTLWDIAYPSDCDAPVQELSS